ncbi:KR domain-containing protein [Xylariaceae sp. FL0255]|nr:KR domain-containing protein [Xylariaceae sp. FL0255]
MAAYYRGLAVSSSQTDGAMLAVGLGSDDLLNTLNTPEREGKAGIACYNSPASTTISGDRECIESLLEEFQAQKVFARILKTGGKAYHSHQMKQFGLTYQDLMHDAPDTIPVTRSPAPMFSTVNDCKIESSSEIEKSYWVRNLQSPVRFHQGVSHMLSSMPQLNVLVEIGPHPALSGPLRQIIQEAKAPNIKILSTLKRDKHDVDEMLQLAGHPWVNDVPLDIRSVIETQIIPPKGSSMTQPASLLVDAPSYPWTYLKKLDHNKRFIKDFREAREPRHDILGRRLLGTSPLEPTWRNVLRLKDLPWVAEHRIGGEVLFPGAAYIACALEAMTQLNDLNDSLLSIESYTIRDFVISAATVVPDDDDGTETLFRLTPQKADSKLSVNGVTSAWYEFRMSCLSLGVWTETCRGRIALNIKRRHNATKFQPRFPDTPHSMPHIDVLDQLRKTGLDLGPSFHHISTLHVSTDAPAARGDMSISTDCGLMEGESRYLLHPTVIDSLFQPVQITAHFGRLQDLRCGYVPTSIRDVTFYAPTSEQLSSSCQLSFQNTRIGNRATISNAFLQDSQGDLIVDISDIRCLLYQAAVPQIQNMFSVVDILLYKDASKKVLALDAGSQNLLQSRRPDLEVTLDTTGLLSTEKIDGQSTEVVVNGHVAVETFDIVVSSKEVPLQAGAPLAHIRTLLSSSGHLILPIGSYQAEELSIHLKEAGFSGIDHILGDGCIVTTSVAPIATAPLQNGTAKHDKAIKLLSQNWVSSSLSLSLTSTLEQDGWAVSTNMVSDNAPTTGQVVVLDDGASSILHDLDEENLKSLENMIQGASTVIWVTRGGLLQAERPDFAMPTGLLRVLRRESESMDLVAIDFDGTEVSDKHLVSLVCTAAEKQRLHGWSEETEYIVDGGVVYVSRLLPLRKLNATWVPDSGEVVIAETKDAPAVRGSLTHGQVTYRPDEDRRSAALENDMVEVHITAIGLSSPDGTDDATFLSHEFAGSIVRMGSSVSGDPAPGTKVCGLTLDNIATIQRVPSSLVQPLPEDCSLIDAATIPSAFTAAMYALETISHVEPGDVVALVDNIGSVALAAIQVCHLLGAYPIIVTTSEATVDVAEQAKLLPSHQIVSALGRDISMQIERATSGRGIDVLLCAATADDPIIVECSEFLNPLGRVVTLGQAIAQTPNTPIPHGKGVSSSHLDLCDLIERRLESIAREGPQHLSSTTWSLDNSWMKRFEHAILIEAHATLEGPSVSAAPKASLKFRPDATYLLVGVLGGLGRQIALWMAKRGARHITFLSRGGAIAPEASKTIEILHNQGVETLVLSADVSSLEILSRAVAEINPLYPVRGVLNAAAELQDGMFHNMTIEMWRQVVNTKVKGSWNLHEIFKNQDLDFFVLTSSVSTTWGSAGQGNYGAANAFLDSLACHRRNRGLPAVSIVLPPIYGIGHIANHPELVTAMQAKGLQGIYEDEMLEAFEIAMSPYHLLPTGVDHFVVGLQPRALARTVDVSAVNFLGEHERRFSWMVDALAKEIARNPDSAGAAGSQGGQPDQGQLTLASIREANDVADMVNKLSTYLATKLGRLLMISTDDIDVERNSIASLGLDSMFGAGFRNWIFREFKIDMPFQQLLSSKTTILELAKGIVERART